MTGLQVIEKQLAIPGRGSFCVPDEGRDFVERAIYEERRRLSGGLLPIMGGAEIFPDEGLDYILNTFPRATQAVPTTLYLGLFTSQTASTVPARTAVLSTATGVTEETSTGSYARAAVANTSWPAAASSGSGMRTTVVAPGISFAESTGAYDATINGFFVATASTAGIAIFYANFSDATAITVNAAGFTVRIAPFHHYDQ